MRKTFWEKPIITKIPKKSSGRKLNLIEPSPEGRLKVHNVGAAYQETLGRREDQGNPGDLEKLD